MKITLPILLILLIQTPVSASAESDFGYPNRYSSIAESLFDMMDAFASAFQKKKREYSQEERPYYQPPPMTQPGYAAPAYPPASGMPYYGVPGPQRYWVNRLDGQWQSNTGEVLIIQQNRFRIYQDRDNFHDGFIHIADEHFLTIQDAVSGGSRQYEYAEQEGRLALRDEMGNMLLFLRLGY